MLLIFLVISNDSFLPDLSNLYCLSPVTLSLLILQVYYSLWRRLLKVFWWLVVAYTMLVLITIYTFQFEDFPDYSKNFTGFTEEQYVWMDRWMDGWMDTIR